MAVVPKRERGESLVEYHDRLGALVRQAEEAGQASRSRALQRAAGKLAARHEEVRAAPRGGSRSGPGTYPWYECVGDQLHRGYDRDRADAICGRIRSDSRKRYPEYWKEREKSKKARGVERAPAKGRRRHAAAADALNPLPLIPLVPLITHAAAGAAGTALARHAYGNPDDQIPYAAIGLDAGPKWSGPGPRDNVIVLNRSGDILEFVEVHGPDDMIALDARYPGLPIFGPFHVLASDIRNLRRRAAHGEPVIEHRGRRT